MKKCILFYLVISVSIISTISCSYKGQNVVSSFNSENYETRIYEVFGMDCPGCHGGLEKLVKKIAVVKHTEANWEKKQLVVIIQSGAQLNDEDIYDAIQRANFTVGKRLK